MTEPVWVERAALVHLHNQSLARHGGPAGLRDEGLLDSALARPRNRFEYEGVDDLCELAATYAVAIAKNHPFIDGNKRAAFSAMGVFLRSNGLRLVSSSDAATDLLLGVAAGGIDIGEAAAGLRANTALA